MQFQNLTSARRQGKSLVGLQVIKFCLATNKKLAIGSDNVDALYERVSKLYPEAKLTKHKNYLLVENE